MTNPQKELETFLKTYPKRFHELLNLLLNPNSNQQTFGEAAKSSVGTRHYLSKHQP